jgi:hypothetical protein
VKQTKALATIALLVASLSACGSQTSSTLANETVAVTSEQYFYDLVRFVRAADLDLIEPMNLRQALPNIAKGGGAPFTTAVVVGHVETVVPGIGYDYTEAEGTTGDEDPTREVAFDDSTADGHDVVVTVVVEDAVGTDGGDTLQFRMGVLADADPSEFMASMRGLGDVALLLSTIPDGSHAGEYYPILNGAGVATLRGSGASLDFPGLGGKASTFADGIANRKQLMAAASNRG